MWPLKSRGAVLLTSLQHIFIEKCKIGDKNKRNLCVYVPVCAYFLLCSYLWPPYVIGQIIIHSESEKTWQFIVDYNFG